MERRHGEGRGKTMDGMSQDRMFGEPSGNPIASSGHPSADMMMKMMKKTLQKYLYSKRFKFFCRVSIICFGTINRRAHIAYE